MKYCTVTYHGLLWECLTRSGWTTAYVCGDTAHMFLGMPHD